ncbi:Lipase 1 [Frankliniella fusca]|uniref:Lipase 1 n=1 Tax=Frankliniella fusca TaxID=407009 RepID=A0AAE1LK34_9NEOP|nr:Lipase 1 [Frankliniella fusca]
MPPLRSARRFARPPLNGARVRRRTRVRERETRVGAPKHRILSPSLRARRTPPRHTCKEMQFSRVMAFKPASLEPSRVEDTMLRPLLQLLLLCLLLLALLQAGLQAAGNRTSRFIFGPITKTSKDLLDMWGYPYEQHRVLTEDGYVLTVDRIPNPGRPPVYLATPYLGAAPIFLTLGRDHALGGYLGTSGTGNEDQGLSRFRLYDAGYDVWMSNVRGSIYSPDHIRLTTDDPEYWKFSFHEHALYDHPACIDMILAKTVYRQLLYIGYSMGSLSLLIMASLKPEYGRKVAAAFLMAPSTTQYYNDGNFISLLNAVTNSTEPVTERLQVVQLPIGLIRQFSQITCRGEARWICNRLWLWLTNNPKAEDYIGNSYYFHETFPGSGSLRTTWHIAQLAWGEGSFRPYVYSSREKNLRRYGVPVPPKYPIERVTIPIFTYTGDSDKLVAEGDYRFMQRSVRSIVRRWRHPDPLFSHADFTFSRGALLVYRQMIKDMDGWLQ